MRGRAYDNSDDLTTLSPAGLAALKDGMTAESWRIHRRRLAKGLPPADEFEPSDEEIREAAAYAAARFPRPSRAGAARRSAVGSTGRRSGAGR